MKTILLKFAGPLQSWGTNSRFETRYTDRYPSKSAVIGMIAASFGYRRDEDEIIQQFNSLDFAVRIDQSGSLLRDYHTAPGFTASGVPNGTCVTNRYYLQDAVFVVAIGSQDDAWIRSIHEALKSPYFHPFLGRRSLPLTADFYIGMTDQSVIESLKDLKWQAAAWYKKKVKEKQALTIYADGDLLENSTTFMTRDRVLSFSQKERRHGFRPVAKMQVQKENENKNENEHDAFEAVGG